jgi:hypothetical protein
MQRPEPANKENITVYFAYFFIFLVIVLPVITLV